MKSAPFVQAIDEMALCVPREELATWDRQPFFLPFGAARDAARGYKSAKYPSNGPDNTAAGWQTTSTTPVKLVPDTRPREWEIVERSGEEYAGFLLVRSSEDGERPRLLDAACWWARFTPFESAPSEQALIEKLVGDLGLTEVEKSSIFEPLSDAEQGTVVVQPTRARSSAILPAAPGVTGPPASGRPAATSVAAVGDAPKAEALASVAAYILDRGFVFEPWQVAAFITAARTKPFVIVAGISGTGKTKLARLVAEATGATFAVIPVQPSWTDSTDLLGFERLDGQYVVGRLLALAREATENPERQFFVLLDEMNIARVEYYLAEVLSLVEERRQEGDAIVSPPLAPNATGEGWNTVGLPANLCLVGSVNMDETTFGFSRKVLDRGFVIEFSSVDLGIIGDVGASGVKPGAWPAAAWRQQSLTLAAHPDRHSPLVEQAVTALETINAALSRVQLQVGYRVRDEIAMFCLHAQTCSEAFVTRDESPIDPLDLAIAMKVLPRIQGGGPAIRTVLEELLVWAKGGARAFPMCAERLELMLRRLTDTGFTSYWL